MLLKNITKTVVFLIASVASMSLYGFEDDALCLEGNRPYTFPKNEAEREERELLQTALDQMIKIEKELREIIGRTQEE